MEDTEKGENATAAWDLFRVGLFALLVCCIVVILINSLVAGES